MVHTLCACLLDGIDNGSGGADTHTLHMNAHPNSETVLSSMDVKKLAHAQGINLRLLGYVRAAATSDEVRTLLLCYLIARVFRHDVRALHNLRDSSANQLRRRDVVLQLNAKLREVAASYTEGDATAGSDVHSSMCAAASALLAARLPVLRAEGASSLPTSGGAATQPQSEAARAYLKAQLHAHYPGVLTASEWEPSVCLWASLPQVAVQWIMETATAAAGVRGGYKATTSATAAGQTFQFEATQLLCRSTVMQLPHVTALGDGSEAAVETAVSFYAAETALLRRSLGKHPRTAVALLNMGLVRCSWVALLPPRFLTLCTAVDTGAWRVSACQPTATGHRSHVSQPYRGTGAVWAQLTSSGVGSATASDAALFCAWRRKVCAGGCCCCCRHPQAAHRCRVG